jgi:hypothetical protein
LSTLATTGEGSAPCSVCVDPSHSDQLLVAFAGLQKCIRRIRADGAVEVLANSDSQFASVDCLLSTALNSDAEPTLYVSSVIDHTVKAMNTHTGKFNLFALHLLTEFNFLVCFRRSSRGFERRRSG